MLAFKLSCFLLLWSSLCSLLKLKSLSNLPSHCNKHMNGWWIAFRTLANKMRLLIFLLTGVLRKDFNFFLKAWYIFPFLESNERKYFQRGEKYTLGIPLDFSKSGLVQCKDVDWVEIQIIQLSVLLQKKNINSLVF